MSSFKPSDGADQVKSCEIVSCGLFVTGGDAAEVLDGVEEPLDEIALAIEREIAVAFDLAVRFRRDHRFDGAHFQGLDEAVAVVPLVAEEGCGRDLSSSTSMRSSAARGSASWTKTTAVPSCENRARSLPR